MFPRSITFISHGTKNRKFSFFVGRQKITYYFVKFYQHSSLIAAESDYSFLHLWILLLCKIWWHTFFLFQKTNIATISPPWFCENILQNRNSLFTKLLYFIPKSIKIYCSLISLEPFPLLVRLAIEMLHSIQCS